MKCKYCEALLEEGSMICPACGKDNAEDVEEILEETIEQVEETAEEAAEQVEETAAESAEEAAQKKPSVKKGKIAAAVAAAVALLAVLGAFLWYGINGSFLPKENDLFYKESYSVEAEVAQQKSDEVVATVGGETLTNAELQIYYWMKFYDFLSGYGGYASYMGLDYTQQLDIQYVEQGITWQHYFLEQALGEWHQYQAICLEGQAAGYVMSEEMRTQIDGLPATMEQTALENGYENAEQMLQEEMGPGATMDAYMDYLETYYYGSEYFDSLYREMVLTVDDVEAYYEANKEKYVAQGLTQDAKLVDVRHILLSVEGGTTDATGVTTYTDEDWENCRVAAQAILDEWLAGEATEDSFAALANTHSTDPGSNTNGGLYTGVKQGQMVETFDAWCFDESRQVGDYGLVKTNYGYHIMYFVGSAASDEWLMKAHSDLMTEQVDARVEEIVSKYPMETDFKKIVLGILDFSTMGQ